MRITGEIVEKPLPSASPDIWLTPDHKPILNPPPLPNREFPAHPTRQLNPNLTWFLTVDIVEIRARLADQVETLVDRRCDITRGRTSGEEEIDGLL